VKPVLMKIFLSLANTIALFSLNEQRYQLSSGTQDGGKLAVTREELNRLLKNPTT